MSLEANRNISKRFKAEKMVETVQEINKSFQEDLWEDSMTDAQKVLQGTIIEHGKLRSIILFISDKISTRNASIDTTRGDVELASKWQSHIETVRQTSDLRKTATGIQESVKLFVRPGKE